MASTSRCNKEKGPKTLLSASDVVDIVTISDEDIVTISDDTEDDDDVITCSSSESVGICSENDGTNETKLCNEIGQTGIITNARIPLPFFAFDEAPNIRRKPLVWTGRTPFDSDSDDNICDEMAAISTDTGASMNDLNAQTRPSTAPVVAKESANKNTNNGTIRKDLEKQNLEMRNLKKKQHSGSGNSSKEQSETAISEKKKPEKTCSEKKHSESSEGAVSEGRIGDKEISEKGKKRKTSAEELERTAPKRSGSEMDEKGPKRRKSLSDDTPTTRAAIYANSIPKGLLKPCSVFLERLPVQSFSCSKKRPMSAAVCTANGAASSKQSSKRVLVTMLDERTKKEEPQKKKTPPLPQSTQRSKAEGGNESVGLKTGNGSVAVKNGISSTGQLSKFGPQKKFTASTKVSVVPPRSSNASLEKSTVPLKKPIAPTRRPKSPQSQTRSGEMEKKSGEKLPVNGIIHMPKNGKQLTVKDVIRIPKLSPSKRAQSTIQYVSPLGQCQVTSLPPINGNVGEKTPVVLETPIDQFSGISSIEQPAGTVLADQSAIITSIYQPDTSIDQDSGVLSASAITEADQPVLISATDQSPVASSDSPVHPEKLSSAPVFDILPPVVDIPPRPLSSSPVVNPSASSGGHDSSPSNIQQGTRPKWRRVRRSAINAKPTPNQQDQETRQVQPSVKKSILKKNEGESIGTIKPDRKVTFNLQPQIRYIGPRQDRRLVYANADRNAGGEDSHTAMQTSLTVEDEIVSAILKWNPEWLGQAARMLEDHKSIELPPIAPDWPLLGVLKSYESIDQYVSAYKVLLLHETWAKLFGEYRGGACQKALMLDCLVITVVPISQTFKDFKVVALVDQDEAFNVHENALVTFRLADRKVHDQHPGIHFFGLITQAHNSHNYRRLDEVTPELKKIAKINADNVKRFCHMELTVRARTKTNLPAFEKGLMIMQVFSDISPMMRLVVALGGVQHSPMHSLLLEPSAFSHPSTPIAQDVLLIRTRASVPYSEPQFSAISSCVSSLYDHGQPDIRLVVGPGGSGKSQTIIGLIEEMQQRKSQSKWSQGIILVTAPTSAAVDELSRKILALNRFYQTSVDSPENSYPKFLKFLRLGSKLTIAEDIARYCMESLLDTNMRDDEVVSDLSVEQRSQIAERLAHLQGQLYSFTESQLSEEDQQCQQIIEAEINDLQQQLGWGKNSRKRNPKSRAYLRNVAQQRKSLIQHADVIAFSLERDCGDFNLLKELHRHGDVKILCSIIDDAHMATELETLIGAYSPIHKLLLFGRDGEDECSPVVLSEDIFEFRRHQETWKRCIWQDLRYSRPRPMESYDGLFTTAFTGTRILGQKWISGTK